MAPDNTGSDLEGGQMWTRFDAQSIRLEADEDPRCWSPSRKWGTTAIISLMGFISPLGSSVVVPGSLFLERNFHLGSRELSLLPVSFFVLGLGVGPFLLAPASELKGRRPIYVVSSIVFVLFNVSTSVVRNFGALCFLRFMAGASGSTGPSLGAGSIGDIFAPRERGRAQSLYGLGPLLGPVCGTIAGGWLAESLHSWRWLMWFLTILSGTIAVVVAFFLRETYAPVLLRKKVRKAAKEYLGQLSEHIRTARLSAEQLTELLQIQSEVRGIAYPDPRRLPSKFAETGSESPAECTGRSASSFFHSSTSRAVRWSYLLVPGKELRQRTRLALTRPFRLLFLNPICAIFSLYMGYIYGIIFIFLTQHPLLFQRRDPMDSDRPPDSLPTYNWSPGLASLTYLGLGLGFLVAASINVLLQDVIYARLVLSRGKIGWLLFYERKDIVAEVNRRELAQSQQEQLAQQSFPERHSDKIDIERQTNTKERHDDGTTSKDASAFLASPPLPISDDKQGKMHVELNAQEKASAPHITAPSTEPFNTPQKNATIDLYGGGVLTQQAVPSTSMTAPTPAAPTTIPGKGRPEYRLPLCLVGMIILPCGLLVFGWTADSRSQFMLPLLGSFLVGVGSILPFQAILVYLVDAFIPYSASATACAVLVRCTLAAVFPLFSEKLFVALGFGWGSTLLAFISALAIPVPIFLYARGEALRLRFRFDG